MRRFKIWSIMMLVVMTMSFVTACSSSDDGEGEPIDMTWNGSGEGVNFTYIFEKEK